MFLAVVEGHMKGLSNVAERTGRALTEEQWAALFRQLCLFYDAVWRQRFPQRIVQTGRVAPEDIPAYVEQFRQASMHALGKADYLPMPYRDWTINATSEALQADFDLYNRESIQSQDRDDFQKILSITQLPESYLLPRLYLRTCQIVGLFERRDPMLFYAWWDSVAIYGNGVVDILDRIVPLPE